MTQNRLHGFITPILTLIVGCGLPDYTVISPPRVLSPSDSHVVAFTTPADDTNILGYAIYYKIYYDDTDRNAEEDESKWFNPSSSIYSVNQMQTGPTVPNQRGFFRLGVLGESDLSGVSEFYIANPGPSTGIYIDFDTGNNGLVDKDSDEPVIGIAPPFPVTPSKTLARGFVDPLDSVSENLRSFIGDWRFDEGNSSGFHDGDLRRKGWPDTKQTTYNVMQYQPGSSLNNIVSVGNPLFGARGVSPEITIGFVTHSFGRNVSGGSFRALYSTPVYIGTISYQNPGNTTKRRH